MKKGEGCIVLIVRLVFFLALLSVCLKFWGMVTQVWR